MKHLLSLLLLFLAASMGMRAQTTAFRPYKHWNQRLTEFAQEGPITASDIVMLGDSHTEKAGNWNRLLGTENVRNRGITSDVAAGIYQRLNGILDGKPKAVFLLIGANDVSHELTTVQVFEEIRRIVERIRTQSPSTRIFIESLLPFDTFNGRWKTLEGKEECIGEINSLLATYCAANELTFINLYPRFVRNRGNILRRELTTDGLHLNRLGYKIWAHELRPYINELADGK